ncbi:dynein regulatory complex protein 1 homolog [Drosophila kikkawai]|uniref:Dynein regulatory complex protein 1 homolog n=1 Tax=Drosophila kikkawai TaxID=30033 RepID=A0A6P4J385_DROKI|nr:dynein regulatory complex protein 1 homolog [Drosophila kikkawai]
MEELKLKYQEMTSDFLRNSSSRSSSEEKEEAAVGPIDSWESFNERVDGLILNEHCDSSVKKLEDRRLEILDRVRQQFREAPKNSTTTEPAQKAPIEKQLEVSGEALDELVRFGNVLVTNVRVANERRELNRRVYEATQKSRVQAKLQAESLETVARFADIKARWKELEEINEPMMLWDQIEEQKKRIAAIMGRKDEMIAACQQEVNRMNAKYEFDRERQAQDLCGLVERVDHQVETLKEAYKQHLLLLRHTIEEERQIFAASAVEKWRTFFDAMNANFEEKANLVRSREQFYARQTQQINESQEELTKSTRIRLEKECERLELELRRTRDNVLMNSEKLDYNYEVLQKRNEENAIINGQQKRRVARLQEAIGRTRRGLRGHCLTGKRNIARLSGDIYKLHANINDMEAKAHQARLNNREKFDRIWDINYRELSVLVERIYRIDRTIHDQQLAMPWLRPVPPIPNINQAKMRPNNVLQKFDMRIGRLPKNRSLSSGGRGASSKQHRPDIKDLPPDSLRLMRTLIRQLSDRGGFLIEERLLEILEPYSEEDKCLVRIDNIFAALHIRHLRDVQELTRMFLPYTYCPTCQPEGLSPRKCAKVFLKDRKPLRDQELHSDHSEEDSPRDCPNHYLVMEPALCLHAMNLFTTKMHQQMHEQERSGVSSSSRHMVTPLQITDAEIRDFWRQFAACFPPAKRKLWKTLEHGLNHYVEVLKMRVQYDAEVVFLRRQNEELRHLLQKFTVQI